MGQSINDYGKFQIRITTLVRRALEEVCTVPALLVLNVTFVYVITILTGICVQ